MTQLRLGLAAASLAYVLSVAGCGSKVETPLPELPVKRGAAGDRQPLSTAEQKKAIDEMIAKRDGKEPTAK